MTSAQFSVWFLGLKIHLSRVSAIAVGAGVLCMIVAVALLWLSEARDSLAQQQDFIRRRASLPTASVRSATTPVINENLTAFYGGLGDRRHAEQQVNILFGIAAKSGLALPRGDYSAAYDKDARIYTYQVSLPVKGSYRAISQFALLSLRTIPFASLDNISFKRESIGDSNVEARLRLTLYLSGTPPVGIR